MITKRALIQDAIDTGFMVELNVLSSQATILRVVTPNETYDLDPQDMLLLIFANGRDTTFSREKCTIVRKGG